MLVVAVALLVAAPVFVSCSPRDSKRSTRDLSRD